MGCVVTGRSEGERGLGMFLTCEHVVGLAGNGASTEVPVVVEQPAPVNQIGQLPDFSVGVVRRVGGISFVARGNRVDAAVVVTDPGIELDTCPMHWPSSISRIAEPRGGMRVVKVGCTTGLREGVVTDAAVDWSVDYADRGSAHFHGVTLYRCRCEPGDSGAAVLDADTGALVGLHFAGRGMDAVMCPITAVFAALRVQLPERA